MSDLPNPNMTVRGDMTVGRNVTVGGNQIVRGNMTVEQSLNVKGWLSVENLNFPAVGIFGSEAALEAAVTPKPGYIAGVITGSQGLDYTVKLYDVENGAWTATNITLPVRVVISATTNIEGIDAQEFAEWQQEVNDTLDTKADKRYLNVTPGTGVTTIQLKDGVYATVLTEHQSISGKADKLGSGHENRVAALDANGNLADSGYDKVIFKVLGVQTGYFSGILGTTINVNTVDRFIIPQANPEQYSENVFLYPNNGHPLFVYYDATKHVYYSMWGDKGEAAYMNGDGSLKKNKLYVEKSGIVYYVKEENLHKINPNINITGKADKVSPVVSGNFAALDGNGNLTDSGHKHSDYVTDVSGKADKRELTVATADGVTTINLKGSGLGATKATTYTPTKVDQLLGLPVGETVRAFIVAKEDVHSFVNQYLDPKDIRLIVVDGVAYRNKEDWNSINVGAGDHTVEYVFADASKIPDGLFSGFDGSDGRLDLQAVHIPSHIHNIGKKTFMDCVHLTKIDCEAMTPPAVESDAFSGVHVSDITLTVHKVVESLYNDGSTTWCGVGTVNKY